MVGGGWRMISYPLTLIIRVMVCLSTCVSQLHHLSLIFCPSSSITQYHYLFIILCLWPSVLIFCLPVQSSISHHLFLIIWLPSPVWHHPYVIILSFIFCLPSSITKPHCLSHNLSFIRYPSFSASHLRFLIIYLPVSFSVSHPLSFLHLTTSAFHHLYLIICPP